MVFAKLFVGGGQYPSNQFNNQFPQGGAGMGWYPGGFPTGYDYNSGYGGYGAYGNPGYNPYGMYAAGYNGYGSGYGGYGGGIVKHSACIS